MKQFAPYTGFFMLIAAQSCNAQTLSMGSGLWTISTQFESANLPSDVSSKLSEKTREREGPRCLKKARDLWTLQTPFANGKRKCEQTDFQLDGDRMTWRLDCLNGMKHAITVVSPSADSFVATMAMTGAFGKASFVIAGKRTAEICEAK